MSEIRVTKDYMPYKDKKKQSAYQQARKDAANARYRK